MTCWGSVREDNLLERPQQKYCKLVCIHVDYHIYMHKNETPIDVHRWFVGVIRDLWPVAVALCLCGGDPVFVRIAPPALPAKATAAMPYTGRREDRRFSIYVPQRLVPQVRTAIQNGRRLQELINEAGVRYMNALKRQDSKLNT